MKKNLTKKVKKIKKIFSKIIKDKQLLAIFLLFIIVILLGCFIIGILRTLIILTSLAIVGYIINLYFKNKYIEYCNIYID